MERSWLVSAVVGIAALGAGRVSTAHALSMLPAGCVFLSGIVLGWWACCKVYLTDSVDVQHVVAPEGMRSFTGTYRDPQKEELHVIRDSGMVSVRSSKSGRMLRGWVEDEVLTVEFPNKTVRGWMEGGQLVWQSRAPPWKKCGE